MTSTNNKEFKLNLTNETEVFLADFVTHKLVDDEETRNRIKEILYDTIGVMLAGSRTDAAKKAARIASREMSGHIPLLAGGGGSLLGATFANSATAYSLDIDTVYEPSTLHISAILVPLILSLAAEYRLSLREAVDAFHVGYNVAAAFGDAMTSKEIYARYFHPTTIVGAFGASASSSRILCNRKEESLNSLRLVSTMTSGLTSVFNELSHQSAPIQVANSALSGIKATILAKEGVNGPPLFYKKSVFFPFSGKQGLAPEARLKKKITEGKAELKTSFKQHSACLFLQAGIDAALQLREEIGVPSETDRIELTVDPTTVDLIDNAGDMTHNAQLVLSMAFIYGRVLYEDYPKALKDTKVLHMKMHTKVSREKMLAGHYPESLPAIVTVTSRGGRKHDVRVNHHKGHFKNPMGPKTLRAKFMILTNRKKEFQDDLESIIFGNETADVSEIISLARGDAQ
jgi:2-methylcitrate dehydratase PrpD